MNPLKDFFRLTSAGLLIAGALLGVPLLEWQLVIVVMVLQFCVEMFISRHYALAQMFVTPLALLMTEVAHPTNPWLLIRDRGIETVVGAAVGIAFVVAMFGIARRRRGDAAVDRAATV